MLWRWSKVAKAEVDKGKLIYSPETRIKALRTKKGLVKMFIIAVILNAMILFWVIAIGVGFFPRTARNIVLNFILISLLPITLLGLYGYNPLFWNRIPAIYENGVSGINAPFISYNDITKIGFGRKENGTRFIKIYSNKRPPLKCPTFEEEDFTKESYERILKLVKEKIPDVPWEEEEWLEWKKKKKPKYKTS